MNFLKPKFWHKKFSILSIVTWPISVIFYIIVLIRKKYSSPQKFNIPIICIGNIYIGGTGKTPLSIFISNQLKHKKKSVIIKKFYKEHDDENRLIKANTSHLILNKKRIEAIREAQKKKFDLAILDDGFQDYSFFKDLNILCFNSKQLVGNNLLFPSGPLRDKFSSLKNAQIVVINGKKNNNFEKKILDISKNINIFYTKYIPSNIKQFQNKKLLAFAGIGNPENFFDILKESNLNVQKTLSFPDHYKFNKIEIQNIIDDSVKNNLQIITTEKDYYRIKDYEFKTIEYLKLEIQMLDKNRFINRILNCL